jgi:hypothetical protein
MISDAIGNVIDNKLDAYLMPRESKRNFRETEQGAAL